MRVTVNIILISCREGTLHKFPLTQYPEFTRVNCALEFLNGAAAGLRVYERDSEAGEVDDVIAGIRRDGFKYLEQFAFNSKYEPFRKVH